MRLVTMVMLYLCFSKYCIILGLVTKLRWQLQCLQRNAESKNTTNKCMGTWPSWQLQYLQRNAESKNTTNKWVHGFYFTLIMVAWGPRKVIARNWFWIPKNCTSIIHMSDWKISLGLIYSGPSSNHDYTEWMVMNFSSNLCSRGDTEWMVMNFSSISCVPEGIHS